MNKRYKYLLFNVEHLSSELINSLLYELELFSLAVMLKTKFNDSRSHEELLSVICTEFNITGYVKQ